MNTNVIAFRFLRRHNENMDESEFLEIVDLAFANIGYQIKKEVSFPFVRIDRVVTNTCHSFVIEAEDDISSFGKGIQQLNQVARHLGYDQYSRKSFLVLAIPDCPPNMIERARREGIRVLNSEGLERLLKTEVEKPRITRSPEPFPLLNTNDLAFLTRELEEKIYPQFALHSPGKDRVLEMTDPKADPEKNWYPLLRLIEMNSISFFSGIKERDMREGRSIKISPEWEALEKRLPSKYVMEELQIRAMLHTIGWDAFIPRHFYCVFEKMYHMAFANLEPYNLECKLYQSADPFALAYPETQGLLDGLSKS